METDNPFAVLAEQVRADEQSGLPQYGPVGRLRFLVWSVGLVALAVLLFVALLTFAGGLGMLALPLLFLGWIGGYAWLVRARLRNVGFRQWWLLLAPVMLFGSFAALTFLSTTSSSILTDVFAQATSLLTLLNLPLLLICALLPTGFADRRRSDLPVILVLLVGGTAAVLVAMALLWGLFGW